jgi:hypothetical protein
MLWRNGEAYHYDSSQSAPLCWVPDQPRVLAFVADGSSATAARTIAKNQDGSLTVTVQVNPGSDASAYAVEEKVPEGWTAISDSGSFNSLSRTIRWGLFADSNARSLTYKLSGLQNSAEAPTISGRISIDGQKEITISGDRPWISTVERGPNHSLHLRMQGPTGQAYMFEGSPDLKTWTLESSLFLPDGELDYSPDDATTKAHRYYRLKAR